MSSQIDRRLALIVKSIGLDRPAGSEPRALADSLGEPDGSVAYLVLGVFRGCVPSSAQVEAALDIWRTEGATALISSEVRRSRLRRPAPEVVIASGTVVDVTETAASAFTTGIQRVARESLRRWRGELTLVCWQARSTVLRLAGPIQSARARGEAVSKMPRERGSVVLPFRARFILPELAIDAHRLRGIRSIAVYSGSTTTAIAFDCIPMTTAEVVAPGMAGAFADYLSVLSRFDRLAAISDAAAFEYKGWRQMLSGAGLRGPEITAVALPFEAGRVTQAEAEAQLARIGVPADKHLVLNVGSHEPRKNHVSLLFAAELLWREGLDFTLALLGGNAWETAPFDELVESLQGRGRSLHIVSRASDTAVWSLYSAARFSVFCSLNEGFGLPVAESLASGTPVITSDFGSMQELALGNGGVVVDPTDVDALAQSMRRLLTDDELLEELRGQTAGLEASDWDGYAAQIWEYAAGAPHPAK